VATPWQADARDWIQFSERFLFLQVLGHVASSEAWKPMVSDIVPAILMEETESLPLKLLSEGWNGPLIPLTNSNQVLHERVTQWQRATNLTSDWCGLAVVATAAKLKRHGGPLPGPTAADIQLAARHRRKPITLEEAQRVADRPRGVEFELPTMLRISEPSSRLPAWDPDLQTEAQYRATFAKELRASTNPREVDNYVESVRRQAQIAGKRLAGVVRRSALTDDMRRLIQWQVLKYPWIKIMPLAFRDQPIHRRTRTNTMRQRSRELAQNLGLEMRSLRPGRPRKG
jgi:hypothetical protein